MSAIDDTIYVGPIRPQINVDATPRDVQIDRLRRALQAADDYYMHSGKLVRLTLEVEKPTIIEVPIATLTEFATRAFDWVRVRKGGVTHVDPPLRVVAAVHAAPGSLRRLARIADMPCLTPSGRIVAQTGYDAEIETYLHFGQPLALVPEAPSDEHVAEATALLLDAATGFVFADVASRANAIAAAITPMIRRLYPDLLTPVFAVDAPDNNYGKTTLAQSVAAAIVGRAPEVTPMTMTDGTECRRTLYSLLRSRPSAVILDNIATRLAGDAIAAIKTSRRTQDRAIKTSTAPVVEDNALWFATGTLMTFSRELAIRSVLVQLVAKPSGTRDPIAWAIDNRMAIQDAKLTLLRAWLSRGRPLSSMVTHPKYPRWAAIIGGIFEVAGITDLLANQHLLATRDDETLAWIDLVERWATMHGGPAQHRRVSEIIAGAAIAGEPAWDLVADARDDAARAKILGHALRRRANVVVIAGWIIRAAVNTHRKVHEYWLEPTTPPNPSGPMDQEDARGPGEAFGLDDRASESDV